MLISQYGTHINLETGEGNDDIAGQIQASGRYYEYNFLEYIQGRYPNHKHIVDVGANCGNHSSFFSRFLTHTKLSCFEPQERMLKALRVNVPDADIYPYALGSSESLGTYHHIAGNAGATSVLVDGGGEVIIKTLDSFKLEDITLLKVDVEDYELEVLKGGVETIDRYHPVIFLECRTPELWARNSSFLRTHGYDGDLSGHHISSCPMYEFRWIR